LNHNVFFLPDIGIRSINIQSVVVVVLRQNQLHLFVIQPDRIGTDVTFYFTMF